MYLKELEISGFKSFAKKSHLKFDAPISAIVGPNGSGKSNIAEAFRFVLGEQSFKSMRGKRGEDLIFNGTPTVGRQGRATVKVVFDNSDKRLPVDFEEVSIERVVHRDGVNEYSINGSQVRLKDVSELLASANIGSSGHHIISQGEADRILNSSPKERKAMLEDALGLKIFQYKRAESERKLSKTEDNIEQVQSLRKEIAPHLKFLQKQVQKVEEGKRLKENLLGIYKKYLKIESVYIENTKTKLSQSVGGPKARLAEIDATIAAAEAKIAEQANGQEQSTTTLEIKSLEQQVGELTQQKENLLKEEGRVEGQIISLQNLAAKQTAQENSISIDRSELDSLNQKIAEFNNQSETTTDIDSLRGLVKNVIDSVKEFLNSKTNGGSEKVELQMEVERNKGRITEIQQQLAAIAEKENDLKTNISNLRQKLDQDKSSSLEAEKQIISLMSEKNILQQEVSKHAIAQDTLNRDEGAFKLELTEAAVLVGREVLEYEAEELDEQKVLNREGQLADRKNLERLKIKVEEFGAGSGTEITKEYDEATERDAFLLKEIEDLEKSASDLRLLIEDLSQKIENRFHEGVSKINKEFQEFFELMFGGGTASVKVVKMEARKKKDTDFDMIDEENPDLMDEPEEAEEGIDIKVNLPRKKISDLMILSGGERALTSIALLFAISQVNPPPFVILDETDAALDEANSRKYGDMIENLSKNSQLILITHNRETMSRASILYGVTMMGGVSQMLSVAFEEGEQWAK